MSMQDFYFAFRATNKADTQALQRYLLAFEDLLRLCSSGGGKQKSYNDFGLLELFAAMSVLQCEVKRSEQIEVQAFMESCGAVSCTQPSTRHSVGELVGDMQYVVPAACCVINPCIRTLIRMVLAHRKPRAMEHFIASFRDCCEVIGCVISN